MKTKILKFKYRFIKWIAGILGCSDLIDYEEYDNVIPWNPKRRHGLRDDVTILYPDPLENLFNEVQEQLGEDNRTIKINPYYWPDYIGNAGAPVTITITKEAHHSAGKLKHYEQDKPTDET
jgi:hypothetical protein